MSDSKQSLDYRSAGVDIDAGNALVERIKPAVKATLRREVLGGLGGFGSLVALPEGYNQPILVSGTDGVGTKLLLAQRFNQYDGIGIDLVAMCVNDILVQGAEPLFFLDYFACGKLDVDQASEVITSIAEGCRQAGCALVGGETAEMPDMYQPGDFDLAGFVVGVAERDRIIDGSQVKEGDWLLGIASSGPHSNGYSLIRKVLERGRVPDDLELGETDLASALLAPTIIYVPHILPLLGQLPLHGMAHITGGGLMENIIRVIPENLGIELVADSWQRPPVFNWLQQQGNIEEREMLRTFNCGIGYVLIIPEHAIDEWQSRLRLACWPIGQVTAADDGQRVRLI